MFKLPKNFKLPKLSKKKKPSKKILIVSLLALTVVTVSFFVTRQSIETKNALTKANSQNDPAKKDTDGDGLYDWEENLWGTDINNPDTDGDGTSDGDEVAQGRNPLVAGPDDIIYDSGLFLFGDTEGEMSEAKKEFYSLFLQQKGKEIDEMTIASLMQNFDKEEFVNKDKHTLSDLKLSSKNDEDSLRVYGNNLGEIFARYADKEDYPYDEVAIFGAAITNRSSAGLEKLEFVSSAYKNFAEDLLAIKTPMSASEYHLALVNGYSMLSETTGAMRFFFENPLRGGLAYETYVGQTAINQAAFFNMILYFEDKGVVFDENEPGSLFNSPI